MVFSMYSKRGALQLEYNIRSLIVHEYPGIEYMKTETRQNHVLSLVVDHDTLN